MASSISTLNQLHRFRIRSPKTLEIRSGLRELRNRIDTVKSTQKLTEATKLVAAAKIRRAQETVVNGRPFAETLADLLRDLAGDLAGPSPATSIAVVVFTSDRGLCGGLNVSVIKKAENRISEIESLGLGFRLVVIGKRGISHFRRRFGSDSFRSVEIGNSPATAKEAQIVADIVFAMFAGEEVDKVELVYAKFASLVKFEPVIRTLLPLKRNSVDSIEDESFRLTSKEGKLSVERERSERERSEILAPILEFEQDPTQILDAMLPLYLNSQILRVLQEAAASELAARMAAMSNATDNAAELERSLTRAYNRNRQAKITAEILEIVAGAEALAGLE